MQPGIVDQSAFKYTLEKITEVQAMIVNFIAEETMGSSLNASVDAADFEAWIERNKDKFELMENAGFLGTLISQDSPCMIVSSQFSCGRK